jgi:hypothetical protein
VKPRIPGSARAHENTLNACLGFLAIHRVPAWRVNQRAMLTKQGWRTSGAAVGFPDAVAVLPPTGLAIALEIKSGAARLSASQKKVRADWEVAGGQWFTVYNVAELADDLAKLSGHVDEQLRWMRRQGMAAP